MTTVPVTHQSSYAPLDFQIVINPTTTIGDLKKLLDEKIDDVPSNPYDSLNWFKIKLTFGDGTELLPLIFDSTDYDHVDFSLYQSVLPGTKIDLDDRNIDKVYSLINYNSDDPEPILITSKNIKTIYKYFVSEFLDDAEVVAMLGEWNLTKLDYSDARVTRAISDKMDEDESIVLQKTDLV